MKRTYRTRSCQKATAAAAATLSESTTIRHRNTDYVISLSNRFMCEPIPFTTHHIANLDSAIKIGSSMETELSVSAIAAVRKPKLLRSEREPSIHVHGIQKTAPIDTLTARRFNGSQELRLSNTASIPNAAAERKIAPILVASTNAVNHDNTPGLMTDFFHPT